MQFIYIFPRLFLAAWDRACDWTSCRQLLPCSLWMPLWLRCLSTCATAGQIGTGTSPRLGTGYSVAVPCASSADPEPASVPWSFSGMHPCLPVSLLFVCFWPHNEACRILVPWPGIEPRPAAVKAPSPNHWTSRELPSLAFYGVDWTQGWYKPIPSPEIPSICGWGDGVGEDPIFHDGLLFFSLPQTPLACMWILKDGPLPLPFLPPSSNGRL